MPPNGPDSGHPYEIPVPNDFEPVPENIAPGERSKLEAQRLSSFLRSERSNDLRGTWSAAQFSGNYACSTGRIFGINYDLQVPATGDAVVQKFENGSWQRVSFPTPDRTANYGLQVRIQELRKEFAGRAGGTSVRPTPTPDRPAPTPEAAPNAMVSRREAVLTVPGGRSCLVSVNNVWYDVVALTSGQNEFYVYSNNAYQRANPSGPLLKALQAEANTIRGRATPAPTPDRPTPTPDRPAPTPEAAPNAMVSRREAVLTVPGGRSCLVSVNNVWYDVVALTSGQNEFYVYSNNAYQRANPSGPLLKALQAEANTIRGRATPTPTPDRPTPTPDRPAPTPEPLPEGATPRDRAVNSVLRLRFPEGISYAPERGRIERHLAVNHIEDPANYARHMQATAENLRTALAARPGVRGTVTVDGPRLVFVTQNSDTRLVANAQYVLRDRAPGTPRSVSYVVDQGPAAGTEVRFSPNGPTGLNDAQSRQVANYDVYEFATSGGTLLQMYGRDGSLRQSLGGTYQGGGFVPSEIRSYSGQGDPRNPRPSVVRMLGSGTVRMPDREGSSSTVDYRLQRGTHYVPESGEPVRSYAEATDPSGTRQARRNQYRQLLGQGRTRDAANLKAQLDAELNSNLNSVRGWMRNLVTACRGNPKAITEAVTGVMTFTNRFEDAGAVGRRDRADRGADLQSPELTVFLGGGHCKDFAILIQRLCAMGVEQFPQSGARALVCRSHENHASTYYIQEVPRDGGGSAYKLVKMHVIGYEESGPYGSPVEALRHVWDTSQSRHATAFDHARSVDRNTPGGDGLVVFDPPNGATENEAGFGYTRYEDAVPYMLRRMA